MLDFYCPALRLAIEVDGASHAEDAAVQYDRERQELMESLGIHFLRFTNEQVYSDVTMVLECIVNLAESQTGHQQPERP